MLYYFGKGRFDSEYAKLWKDLVPDSGQAETLQGELVRAIGRLASEAYRNGNMNWDSGFRILVQFLRKHLPDPKPFTEATIAEIKDDLYAIGKMGGGSLPIDFDEGEDVYDRVTDRVVEWCAAHPEAIPHAKNPKLKR